MDRRKKTRNLQPTKPRRKFGKGRRQADQSASLLRLRRELSVERAKREVLQGISRVSRENQPTDKLYNYYLSVILKLTRTKSGSILLVDELTKDLVFAACKGKNPSALVGRRVPMGEGIAGWVARTGQNYFTGDAHHDRLIKKEFGKLAGLDVKNILCVPLKISRGVQGVIQVLNKKNRKPFQKDDLDLLESIASQVATVIENTRLFKKYDSKVRKLKTLKEISQVLNSTLKVEEVRRRAMEASLQLMEAEVGSLLLIDETTKKLYFDVALGKQGKAVKEVHLKIGEGIAGTVAKTGKPVIVTDAQKDPRFARKADKKSSFVTRNMVCVPVRVRGKIVGVLQAINKLGGLTFTSWDLEDFVSLADQVAVAIDNAKLYRELQEAFLGTAEALGDAIEAKDAYTAGHTRRVLTYSMLMGQHLDLSSEDLDDLKLAALLHDIGKIGVPDDVLRKPGKLTDEERRQMQKHTVIGPRIVRNIKSLNKVVPGIMHHHEEYDGTGYPKSLKGEAIPVMARIIAVADCFDAMTTDRPYRKGLPVRTALDEIKKMSGTQFEGKVVKAFLRSYDAGDLKATIDGRPTS